MSKQIEIWGTTDPNISAQLELAIRMDLFKEAGLDVSSKFVESGTTMPADILSADKKPFAFTQTPITAIRLHDKGLSSKVVAPLADIAGTQQIVIHPDRGIVQPKDLEGKRIGIAQGAAVYMAVRNMARDYDIDLDNIEFVDLLPHEQVAAFKEGRIDAIACWEPWTTRARNMGGQLYFSGARSEIPGMEGDVNWLVDQACLMIPDEHLNQHEEEVLAVLNVLKKATDFINKHRKDAAKELAGFFDLTEQELITIMRKNLYSMRFDNLFRIGILGFRDFLYNDGRISTMLSEQELYDITLLKKVDPTLVSLEETVSQDISIVGKAKVYYRKEMTLYSNGQDIQFLVADDSKVVRSSLVQTVEILGGEVVGEATTGKEAIDMFKDLRPNFITMDLSMPGMSGIDAIKEILNIEPNANIIVISGTDHKELREEVFNLGAKIFIVKPFDPLQVAEIVGLLLL